MFESSSDKDIKSGDCIEFCMFKNICLCVWNFGLFVCFFFFLEVKSWKKKKLDDLKVTNFKLFNAQVPNWVYYKIIFLYVLDCSFKMVLPKNNLADIIWKVTFQRLKRQETELCNHIFNEYIVYLLLNEKFLGRQNELLKYTAKQKVLHNK